MRMRWLRPQYLLRGRVDLAGERSSGRSGSKSATAGATAPLRRSYLWAAGTALTLVLLHLLLLPPLPRINFDFPEEGEITAAEIKAPFTFGAPYLTQNVELWRYQKVLLEPPVLRVLDPHGGSFSREQLAALRSAVTAQMDSTELSVVQRVSLLVLQFPNLAEDDLRRVLTCQDPLGRLDMMDQVATALLADGVADMLPPGDYSSVLLVDHETEFTRPREEIIAQSDLAERLTRDLYAAQLAPAEVVWTERMTRQFISPNLRFDRDETQLRRAAARDGVAASREFIKGERIVGQGVRVTEQQASDLNTLQRSLIERGEGADNERRISVFIDRIVLLLLAFAAYGWLASVHFPRMLLQRRFLFALAAVLATFLVGAAFALDNPNLGDFAVPVALLSLLVTVLFGDVVGYATTLLAVVLLALLPDTSGGEVVAWLAIGTVTVVAVRRIQKRSQFYQTIGLLALLSLVLVTVIRTAEGVGITAIGLEYVVAMATPIFSVMFALFLLPIVEPLVGVSSDLTLLDLSDLNHPLLQRMALEAPGTFHHSQVVGQLAETAARSINANALLVRVGALFHDIGKMIKPEYYVENQQAGDRNKHDELTPSMSALIIAAHVKDGIELGRRWRLPQAVIDFIPEHHGTQVMEFFYHKALEGEQNETVKVDDFRYPGPKPQSRETAILMLADAVEAATRSIAKPTPGRIREMTKQIIDKRMLSGELDDCEITLQDLARIREAFIPLLTGIHHARISYPGQKERELERAGEKKDTTPRERRGERSVEIQGAPRGEPRGD